LHRLVYFAVPLSLLHYFWLERDIKDLVLVYVALVTLLFAVRLPSVRQFLGRRRRGPTGLINETNPEMDS